MELWRIAADTASEGLNGNQDDGEPVKQWMQAPMDGVEGAAGPAPDCPHQRLGRLPAPRPRVISASKRTDIPAFHLKWMIERCRAGWVDVPNPMFRRASDPLKRLTHVSLLPEHVLAIVWWSKNYAVYQRRHEAFERYPTQYFHFTINPRRPDLEWLEPDVPPLDEALQQARFLVERHTPKMVAWRYDPLVFWMEDGCCRSNWDAEFFDYMCVELQGIGVTQLFTSVADRYRKFEQRMRACMPGRRLRDPAPDELAEIAATMQVKAGQAKLHLVGCAEPALAQCGIPTGSCINAGLLSAAAGKRMPVSPASDTHMKGRETCGCTAHTDIGDYVAQECGYSCIYCYANPNHRRFETPAPKAPHVA